MIYRIEGMKRMVAAVMLAAVLLSGCGSEPADLSASSVPVEEEKTEQESESQQLKKQLIAILNLGRNEDSQVASDVSLDQAAAFFLEYALQNPESYWKGEQPVNLDGMLQQRDTLAFVYDGTIPAVQVGTDFLNDLKEAANSSAGQEVKYESLHSISVAHGEGEKGSVWLILAFYATGSYDLEGGASSEDTGKEPSTDDTQETEETDPEQENQEDQASST